MIMCNKILMIVDEMVLVCDLCTLNDLFILKYLMFINDFFILKYLCFTLNLLCWFQVYHEVDSQGRNSWMGFLSVCV